MTRPAVLTVVLLAFALLGQTGALRADDGDAGSKAFDETLERLRAGLRPIVFDGVDDRSALLDAYRDYYGLPTDGVLHEFGTFRSAGHIIAAQTFAPPTPRGTVVLMHGLFDHTGTLAATVRHLVGLGFVVAAYDQPGHGLSSGQPASISDFRVYDEVFDTFLGLLRTHLPRPYHAMAHSTGAAVLTTRLLSHDDPDLERIVLVAPLVRSAHWEGSTLAARWLEPYVDEVPRVFRDNTSDEAFVKAVREDPMQARTASLDWVLALVEWNERVARYPPSPRPILVIQGDDDDVIDWEYNLEFLAARFPSARIEMIQGGQHQLLGEGKALRARTMELVDTALTSP